jgi:hypothetical protein
VVEDLFEAVGPESPGEVDDGPRHGGDGDPVLDRTVGALQPGHDVDLRSRDEDPAPHHGEVDLAVCFREIMQLCRRLMRSQHPAPGGKAGRHDCLLTGLPGAGDPVDTGMGALPDPGVQAAPNVAVRHSAGKYLRPGEQAMLLLRKGMYVLHTSIKTPATDR